MAIAKATVPAKVAAKAVKARTVIAAGEYQPDPKEPAIPMLYVGPEVIRDGEQTGALDPRSKANLTASVGKFMRLLDMDADGESVIGELLRHLLSVIPDDKFVTGLDAMDSLVLWYLATRKDVASETLAQTQVGEDIGQLALEAMASE